MPSYVIILIISLVLNLSIQICVFADAEPVYDMAEDIGTDTSSFNNNLSSADDDVQKALDTLDNVTIVSTELDPVYSGDPAFGISSGDITNWGTAYTHSQIVTGNPHALNYFDIGLSSNQVIDWTGASAGTIHATNYVDNNTTYTASTGITLTGAAFSTNDGQVVHDDLSGFVANEHIDHTSVTLTAGTNLSGGGDISTNRTFNVDDAFVINSGADTMTGNLTITATDPTVIFNAGQASDTKFWAGVQDDNANDDDDTFQIGDGTTVGTNPFLSIDTLGKVGIGTTGPGATLEVHSTAAQVAFFNYSAGAPEVALKSLKTASVGDGDTVGRIYLQGYEGAGSTLRTAGEIRAVWDDVTDATLNSSLIFYTQNNSTYASEAMIISSGNVGIGTTGPLGRFEVNDGTNTDFIVTTGGSVGIGTTGPVEKLSVVGGVYVASFVGVTTPYITVGTASSGADNRLVMTYNAAGNYGALTISGDTPGDSLVITRSGKVGIGTTNPGAALHVGNNGNVLTDNTKGYQVKDAGGTARTILKITSGDDIGIGDTNLDDMTFNVGGVATAMVIKQTSGNVGIGTTGPGAKLSILESSVFTTSSTPGIDTVFLHDNSNDGTGNYGASIGFSRLGTGDMLRKAAISAVETGANRNAVGLAFFGSSGLTDGGVIEEFLRISSSGNVGIGITIPTTKLEIASGGITITEVAAPATPAATKAVLYIIDDGDATTSLYVKFDDGTAVRLGGN